VFFLLEIHTGVVSQEGVLGELLSSEEKREGILSRVLLVDFLDFDSIISQEEVHSVELKTTFKSSIVPDGIKRKDFSVVLEVFGQSTIGVTTLKLNFEIFLVLLGIRRRDLEVLNGGIIVEIVRRSSFRSIKGNTIFFIENSGEVITVENSENSSINMEVNTKINILCE